MLDPFVLEFVQRLCLYLCSLESLFMFILSSEHGLAFKQQDC